MNYAVRSSLVCKLAKLIVELSTRTSWQKLPRTNRSGEGGDDCRGRLRDEPLVIRKLPHAEHLIGQQSTFEMLLNGLTAA